MSGPLHALESAALAEDSAQERVAELLDHRTGSLAGATAPSDSTTPPRSERVAAPLVVVLGMHRGGTSALAGSLRALGAQFGNRLMPADANNAGGYWEHLSLVAANDRVLRGFDVTWDAPFALPADWLASAAGQRAQQRLRRELVASFDGAAGHRALAIKDPRICRLLPLWQAALPVLNRRVVYVLVVRHPDEVAQSLRRRDGFTAEKSGLLWMQHMLQAEQATRGQPRVVVSYAQLLDGPDACIAAIDHRLGVTLAASHHVRRSTVSALLQPSLRNHRACDALPPRDLLQCVHTLHRQLLWMARHDGTAAQPLQVSADAQQRLLQCVLAQETRSHHRQARKAQHLHRRLQCARSAQLQAQRSARLAAAVASELPMHAGGVAAQPLQRHDVCKLYWRSEGGDYSEQRTCVAAVGFHAASQRVTLRFPSAHAPRYLRIDPSEWPGVFDLADVRIDECPVPDLQACLVHLNGTALAIPPDALSDAVPHALPHALPHASASAAPDAAPSTPAALRFCALDGDPHIEIDLASLPLPQASLSNDTRAVSFLLLRGDISTQLARSAMRDAAAAQAFAEVRRVICAHDAAAARLAEDVAALRAMQRDAETTRGDSADALAKLQQTLDRHEIARRAAHTALTEQMQQPCARTLAALAQLQQQVDAVATAQQAARAWMQRRSLRYWLRRCFTR